MRRASAIAPPADPLCLCAVARLGEILDYICMWHYLCIVILIFDFVCIVAIAGVDQRAAVDISSPCPAVRETGGGDLVARFSVLSVQSARIQAEWVSANSMLKRWHVAAVAGGPLRLAWSTTLRGCHSWQTAPPSPKMEDEAFDLSDEDDDELDELDELDEDVDRLLAPPPEIVAPPDDTPPWLLAAEKCLAAQVGSADEAGVAAMAGVDAMADELEQALDEVAGLRRNLALQAEMIKTLKQRYSVLEERLALREMEDNMRSSQRRVLPRARRNL